MIKPELTATAQSILEQHYKSSEPVSTLAPLKGGEWSAAYKFSFESSDFVIRLSHTAENFYRDKIASQWSSPNLPVPQIITIDRYQNQHYAITPFFYGEAFEDLSAADLEQTIPDFLSMMTTLQSVNLDSFVGYGTITPTGNGAFSSWAEALLDVNSDRPDNLIHGWKKTLAETPEAYEKYERFYLQLEKLVPYCPEQKRLIHSDLLYQNLLVHNHKISAVLDWGCAMVGDPVYDIAIFAFFEPWFPAFTQTNLIPKMQQSFLEQSPNNRHNFEERMVACQIHLTLGNIAYCACSEGKHDFYGHINRLEQVLMQASFIL
jgi:hygromycin-B 4-O-kinase